MADKNTKVKLTNVSDGPRVLNAVSAVVLQPGETADVEISEAELDSALLSEWFAKAGTKAAKEAEAGE